MNRRNKKIVSLAAITAASMACTWLVAPSAIASPFVNFAIFGRLSGSTDAYSASLAVTAGEVVDYQVIISTAGIGTKNTQGATTRTILTGPTASTIVQAGDGMNIVKFDIFQPTTDAIQANFATPTTLPPAWTQGLAYSTGTPTVRSGSNNDLIGISPRQAPGIFVGGGGQLIASGTFTVAAAPSASTSAVKARFTYQVGVANASNLKINANGSNSSGTAIAVFNATETGTDPYTSYTPLQLTTSAVGPKVAIGLTPAAVSSVSTTHAVGTKSPTGSNDLNVTGSNGSYSAGFLTALTTGGTNAYATIGNFTPGNQELIALNLQIGADRHAPSNAELNTLISALTATGVAASRVNASPGFLPPSIAGGANPYDLLLTTTAPGASSAFAYDFSDLGSASSLVAVNVTDLAAIPEPTSLGATALAVSGLLLGRRRR